MGVLSGPRGERTDLGAQRSQLAEDLPLRAELGLAFPRLNPGFPGR
jgi:hypothetical protein